MELIGKKYLVVAFVVVVDVVCVPLWRKCFSHVATHN